MPKLPLTGCLLADEFVISAGCILLKPLPRGNNQLSNDSSISLTLASLDSSKAGPRLPEEYSLVYIRKQNGQKVFAKGRKDAGESTPDAAVRESYEETGYKSTIIELPTPSLAPGTSDTTMNKEAIAVTLRIDRMSREDKAPIQKFIFWWVSEIDTDENGDAVQRVEGTQLAYEDYDVCEMALDNSLSDGGLTLPEDRRMVELTKALLLKRHELSRTST